MKQKVVIRLYMNDDKARRKAMKIAVRPPGVLSAQIGEKEKDQIEVVGEQIDSVELAKSLRKKMGFAEIISVSLVEEKKKEEEKPKSIGETSVTWPVSWAYQQGYAPAPSYYVHDVRARNPDICSIL